MTTPPTPGITWKELWKLWALARTDPSKMEHYSVLVSRLDGIRAWLAERGIGDEFPPCERGCELTAGHDGPCPAPLVETALD